ncbi:ATP-binding protein [Bdellovibrionota bacterium FG-2]
MQRNLLRNLADWFKQSPQKRKPLVLRGARQVGKSWLVRRFAKEQNLALLEINFERDPALRKLFLNASMNETRRVLEAHFGRELKKELNADAVLFLDEIQTAPEVFSKLRYFFEDWSALPVIAAGSLLEFALSELEHSVPVGRIEYLFLGPLQFSEFMEASDDHRLFEFVRRWKPTEKMPDSMHEKLIRKCVEFSWIGGMPEPLSRHLEGASPLDVQKAQSAILETYREDFYKYRRRVPVERLQAIFEQLPSEVGRRWVHSRVMEGERLQAVGQAFRLLSEAQVIAPVFHSDARGLPLGAQKDPKIFKPLFLDIGLLSRAQGLNYGDFVSENPNHLITINSGAVAEQWIGQHLLYRGPTYARPALFYWVREVKGSLAEVDYVITSGREIIPVEVKAGSSGKLRSLQQFMKERKTPIGLHFSMAPPFLDRATLTENPQAQILHLPFYMVSEVERLLHDLITKSHAEIRP